MQTCEDCAALRVQLADRLQKLESARETAERLLDENIRLRDKVEALDNRAAELLSRAEQGSGLPDPGALT